MKRLNIKYLTSGFLTLLFAGFLMISCSESTKNARLEVRLTDAPGDYDAVYVDIQGVEVHSSAGEQASGWKSLDIQSGVYNLLDFTNGVDTLLGSIELPAGRISQIRLKLGSNNSLLMGDDEYDLGTPSAQQSGLKLNVHATLVEGVTYTLLLDFDAAKSIVKTGNNSYKLKPVIRVITEATSGAIDGTISNPEASPAVFALAGLDTVATTFADSVTGKFLLRGVPAGTYTVNFAPATGFSIDDVNDVSVTIGNVTHLGEIEVNQ
jgi:hypothetical protein